MCSEQRHSVLDEVDPMLRRTDFITEESGIELGKWYGTVIVLLRFYMHTEFT
jgi:hypothetical protein